MRNDWLGLKPLRPLTTEEIELIKEQRQDILFGCAWGIVVVGFLCYCIWLKPWSGPFRQIPYFLLLPTAFLLICFYVFRRASMRLKDDLIDGMVYELRLDHFKIRYFPWLRGNKFYILKGCVSHNMVRRICYIASKKGIFRAIKSHGPDDILHVTKNISFIVNK